MPLPAQIREDCKELVSLAAQITDAHSSAIFLPTELLRNEYHLSSNGLRPRGNDASAPTLSLQGRTDPNSDPRTSSIDLVAVYSRSRVARDARIPVGASVLGWVAEHGRSIHLNPCELNSSAIGIYADHQPIKSLIAVPIRTSKHTSSSQEACGVLVCDSLKADSFTNTHVSLIEQVGVCAHRLIIWAQLSADAAHGETSWDHFKHKTQELGDAIGANSIEFLRIRIDSFSELESMAGLSVAVQTADQFLRLAQQSLPPHFPTTRLPNGDIVIAVDNMMSAFFRQKLETLLTHLNSPHKPLRVSIVNFRSSATASGQPDVESVFQQKSSLSKSSIVGGTRA
jgi:hypothetical protein